MTRKVEDHDGQYHVTDSTFTTSDRDLAHAVAREFDEQDGTAYPSIGTERVRD
jgi:hypothetical protein